MKLHVEKCKHSRKTPHNISRKMQTRRKVSSNTGGKMHYETICVTLQTPLLFVTLEPTMINGLILCLGKQTRRQ